ncbi:sulfatase family protein [Calycomorphotria hydatis]|uniref:Arylsulfatase n=1 Tax=Calycomorphotria hydatis TaxID=2528027 RepID=A0A517T430_9PLAN|nr:sulfatase [Calycomorphotria hydatis]QDT63119.1 Arylsulfatase [Calycomorphotria hydatis]
MIRFLLCLFLFAVVAPQAISADRKPNFVVMYCDDLGYGDLSCFGATHLKTPNVDMLASEGMKLTSFYSTSGVCTPSRSSLMTGCYPIRVNMHTGDGDSIVLFPGQHKGLNAKERTVAEVLKDVGYATGMVGKWHLGDQPEHLPRQHGFDFYFGVPYSNDMTPLPNNWRQTEAPLPLILDDNVIETAPDQHYLTRRYTEHAVNFIKEHRDEPFFLYWPQTFPHWPHYASPEFTNASPGGVYGDCIEEVDWSLGQLMATLKALDLDDDTLILFSSDNGARMKPGEGSNGPLKGTKGTTFEGGHRVPCVVRWPGHVPAGSVCNEMTTTMDVLPTFAALAGGEAPADRIIDGHDIRPLLFAEEGAATPYDAFYYYRRDRLECVRSGPWKLRIKPPFRYKPRKNYDENYQPQLYNLENEIGEETNVAAEHPEVVQELMAFAKHAQTDLGDSGHPGENTRPAGWVEDAKKLTLK